jgi:hemerythrin superfamily protein
VDTSFCSVLEAKMPRDVIELIMERHREVETLFQQIKRHPDQRRLLVPRLADLLTAHSRAEAAEIFPVARAEAGEHDEIAPSRQAGSQAGQILKRLGSTPYNSSAFEVLLNQLVDTVRRHIQEQEEQVLPLLRSGLSQQRRTQLAEAFGEAFDRHMADQSRNVDEEGVARRARYLGTDGTSRGIRRARDELRHVWGES